MRHFGIVHKRFSHGVCLFQGIISIWCYFVLTMALKKRSTILTLHGYGQIMFILILLICREKSSVLILLMLLWYKGLRSFARRVRPLKTYYRMEIIKGLLWFCKIY